MSSPLVFHATFASAIAMSRELVSASCELASNALVVVSANSWSAITVLCATAACAAHAIADL